MDERLHVSVSMVDLVAASLLVGSRPSDLFRSHYKIGTSPMDDNPWIQRFVLELKKPCAFLVGRDCDIYGGRPIACALFPEAFFISPEQERGLDQGKFGHYPCLREPPAISERRRSHLIALMEMARQEAFLTEFYLFGFSPFCIDLRNIVMEVVELSRDISGCSGDDDWPWEISHRAFEEIVVRKLRNGGYLSQIGQKVESLNSPGGIEELYSIKTWTDLAVGIQQDFPYWYEFDGRNRLRLVKRQT